MDNQTRRPKRLSSPLRLACNLLVGLGFLLPVCSGRSTWTELNIGPFYVDVEGDTPSARTVLTQLEQVRWVLENLLEAKDLVALWPIRILLTKSVPPSSDFVSQNGQYLFAIAPGQPAPLAQVAKLLIDSNTPRLPNEAESGLLQLFSSLEAHGSHVTWGGPVPQPDLAWARMQLFATKPEYAGRFHILVSNLRDNSSLSVAERNAFGKDPALIEKEAQSNLESHSWQAVPVSGRPLDPKRDFGEHAVESPAIGVFMADLQLQVVDRKAAQTAYKTAIEAGGQPAALGYEALAHLATLNKEDPKPLLDEAIHAGSRSAPVYLAAAEVALPVDTMPLLKRAEQLNPRWAEPLMQEVEQITDFAKSEELLKKAALLSPRTAAIWETLAELQLAEGHVAAAQGTWLRAENAADGEAERDRIHKRKMESEDKRLDAAEEERRQARLAATADDRRAQTSEADRIHRAEERANQALDAEAGGDKPGSVVDWSDLNKVQKLQGKLTRVDCLSGAKRLSITAADGKTVELSLRQTSQSAALSCGKQQPPRKIAVSYSAAGEVIQLSLQ